MLLGLALIVGLIPIRVRCGNLRFSCAVPSPRGGIIYSYEVEPLAVTVVETLLGANMGLYYYSGREWVRP
jgi:hypothetical protein